MPAQTLYDERYKKLNKEQKKAVDTIEGPLLVVAGPGSGKTEILSLRVGNILRQTDTLPGNILCLTFTESAALNMRERLAKLIGAEAYRIAIHTFHDFCVSIIQRYPEFFYGGALFESADELSQTAVLEDILETLPHTNPLRSFHPEQGYVYLRNILSAIGYLKKAGLRPEEFKNVIEHNKKSAEIASKILGSVFDERLTKSSIPTLETSVRALLEAAEVEEKASPFPAAFFKPLLVTVAESLGQAVAKAEESDSTKPLSLWKQKMMKVDDNDNRVFKDELGLDKMTSLALIYERYQARMHTDGLYDFDDMILDAIAAVESNPRLRSEIQEQYQYILVDEFQDTNTAQMRLLHLLTDAPVNEGRPNLMVVGDDDQAIYKFQGAELSNILDFRKTFLDVELVTMTDNYRSTQNILDLSTRIIRRGENRLENLIPELEKTLVASNPEMKKATDKGTGGIIHRTFPSNLHEYHFVSREIKRLIEAGHKPEEIAVIARKHRELESLVPYMRGALVPIRYEREQNVFLEPHIQEIIVIARFVASLNRKDQTEADNYLPQILSFPFWNISREEIWRLSVEANKGREEDGVWHIRGWLELMLEHKNTKLQEIAHFLIELGAKAQNEPLEKILDMIIGAHTVLLVESEDDDDDAFFDEKKSSKKGTEQFVSPFKEYYFSQEKFTHARTEYLSFLSSLRVFVRALREYKSGKLLSILDLVAFVDLHEKNKIALNDKSPFASAKEAVSLLTAHKAKGLEFETVFILSCQDEVWAGRSLPNKLPMPLNLPIEPAGDGEDDRLRLFYVALTRAKHDLYLLSYEVDDTGERSSSLRFLLPQEGEEEFLKSAEAASTDLPETHEVLTASWLSYHTPPFLGEEEDLLRSLLEKYQLSVTHLNNFLDITKGGPQLFLEQNLLRFPQAKTPSSSFGSAIHRTLEKVSVELRRTGEILDEETLLKWFEEYLRRERLSSNDFVLFRDKGREALTTFYKKKKEFFLPSDKTEVNFKNQGVTIGEAHLTGKIDRVVDTGGGNVEVFDYKTGKAPTSWQGKDDREKIKLRNYERQLIFYKLLVEHSRDYAHSHASRGVLQFIEPQKDNIIELSLDLTAEKEKIERTRRLVEIVFKKIMNLDFPDVSKYSSDLEGNIAFEDDLLLGTN